MTWKTIRARHDSRVILDRRARFTGGFVSIVVSAPEREWKGCFVWKIFTTSRVPDECGVSLSQTVAGAKLEAERAVREFMKRRAAA